LQDGGSNSDWKRAYDDVVGQLKAAQDRRNELAAENERLQKRLAEAEKRLAPLAARNVELEREAGEYAARTYDLRLLKARVDLLLQVHPEVRRKWQQVLQGEAAPESLGFLSRRWPLRED
jgi:predicted nuclease with TOPRIM domain